MPALNLGPSFQNAQRLIGETSRFMRNKDYLNPPAYSNAGETAASQGSADPMQLQEGMALRLFEQLMQMMTTWIAAAQSNKESTPPTSNNSLAQ
jgi:hypothetical protein